MNYEGRFGVPHILRRCNTTVIYHTKFVYKNKKPSDFGLINGSFNPDNGEVESFLTMEPSTTESYDGTKVFDYGAKFSSTAELTTSLIKSNGSDFTGAEVRSVCKWLTGARIASQLDLYDENDNILYSFFGRFTNVQLYKADARVWGIIATFTTTSPWAYSAQQTITQTISTSRTLTITNSSDDEYTYIYPKVTFTNGNSAGSLTITNTTLSESTTINNIAANEIITMDSNQIILSDRTARIFGDDFNFKWPRLAPGDNSITITGNGDIVIQYRNYLKVADALLDI